MIKKRRYHQLCPIARALNHVGDRWALLILRDLLAGPARFGDLQQGLTGIATNLLTTRLHELQASGLIQQRRANYGVQLYELTELGKRSEPVLQAMVEFGAHFAPEEDLKVPGNLRLLCVPLKAFFQQRVEAGDALKLELTLGDEPFSIEVLAGEVEVQLKASPEASIRLSSPLKGALDWLQGRLEPADFSHDYLQVVEAKAPELERVMSWIEGTPAP